MSQQAADRKIPQLVMQRPDWEGLEDVVLPAGCRLAHYEPGMEEAWERIISESFDVARGPGYFENAMRKDYAFRPERVLFVLDKDAPVATSSAWYKPEFGPTAGYLHMVGVLPEAGGKRLGYWVSLACLHQMRAEGRTHAVLQTDDFRLAAVKTYLRMGFIPRLIHENQRQRWLDIFDALGMPERTETHAALLEGPLDPIEEPRPDLDKPGNYDDLPRWIPNRPHKGKKLGMADALAGEALYKASRLGAAEMIPAAAEAGSPVEGPIELRYTVGEQAIPTGGAVRFVFQGQQPLGFRLVIGHPDSPSNLVINAPEGIVLEPYQIGFRVKEGALEPGASVTLRCEGKKLTWTPIAAKRPVHVGVSLPGLHPELRLPAPLLFETIPSRPERLEALTAATQEPGEPAELRVTLRDRFDNRVFADGRIEVSSGPDLIEAPMRDGLAKAALPVSELPRRLEAKLAGSGLCGESNAQAAPIEGFHCYIGDLHCHDFLSEAEGYPDEIYRWAIEDKRLDFVSIVPQSHGWHDNETWTLVKYMNERYLEEGRFVPFLGFEWQHTGYGDKVVHYLADTQPLLPVDDKRYDHALKLYEALRQSDALVIGHHPAYKPGSWCSSTDYDALAPDIERLTEIWSMHGSAEGVDPADRPYPSGPHEANYTMNVLKRGVRVGFTAGSDTHAGRPGGSAKEPRPYWGGLTAVWAPELTRRALFDALYARRTVALTQARILLWMTVNGAPMGSEIEAADKAVIHLNVQACGPIASVELMKNAECHKTFTPQADVFDTTLEDPCQGPAFYHARVTQKNGHLAVCSPVWVG